MKPHPCPWLDRLAIATLALGGFSLVALSANLVVFALLYPPVVAFEPLPVWTDRVMNGLVGPAFLVVAVAHLVALATLGWQIRVLQGSATVPALLVALGVVSLLLVAGNFPLLGDIGKEYKAGLDTGGEWRMVFANQGLHAVFLVLAALRAGYANRQIAAGAAPEPAVRDEAVLHSVHVIGAFSGLAGLALLASLVLFGFPLRFLGQAVGVLGGIVVAPHVLVVASWLWLKRAQPPRDWLDEKQASDLGRAALAALLVAFPLLTAGYVLFRPAVPDAVAGSLSFPVTAFLTLLVFSSVAARLGRQAAADAFPGPS